MTAERPAEDPAAAPRPMAERPVDLRFAVRQEPPTTQPAQLPLGFAARAAQAPDGSWVVQLHTTIGPSTHYLVLPAEAAQQYRDIVVAQLDAAISAAQLGEAAARAAERAKPPDRPDGDTT